MGNRANVVFVANGLISPAVYLHWNGGPESVYAFLAELDRRKIRSDAEYECARFIELVGEFFDNKEIGTTSLGVINGPTEITGKALNKVYTDSGNNGFYIVDRTGKKMVVRRFQNKYRRKPKFECLGLHELSRRAVLKEEREAWKNPYNTGEDSIAKTFLKIQGKRKLSEWS